MVKDIARLSIVLWSLLYSFIFVSELSGVSSGWGVGHIKHISFILLMPVILIAIWSRKINKTVFMLFGLYGAYVIIQSILLEEVNFTYLYARLVIPFFYVLSISLNSQGLSIYFIKLLFYSLLVFFLSFLIVDVLLGFQMYQFTNRLRFTGGFIHAGKFASILLALLLLSWCVYPKRKLIYIFSVVCLSGVLYSQTRNVEVSLIIGAFYYLLGNNRNYVLPMVALLGGVIGLGLFISDDFYNWVDAASSSRLYWWKMGFDLNFNNDVISILFGTNSLISPLEYVIGESKTLFHFDNSYLEILLRDGVIGLMLALIVMYIAFTSLPRGQLGNVLPYTRFIQSVLVIYFFFDSGLFGTGSLLFVALWVMSSTSCSSLGLHVASR